MFISNDPLAPFKNMMADPLQVGHESLASGKPTLILVHGLASCALLSKVDESAGLETGYGCCKRPFTHDWRLGYVNLRYDVCQGKVAEDFSSLDMRLGTTRLHDGTEVATAQNHPGVQVRVVEGLNGISNLCPGEFGGIPLWSNLIYKFGKTHNLLASNYDWRRWGDLAYVEEQFHGFRAQVEEGAATSGQPVTIIAHSMGASVVLYNLNKLGSDWTTKSVRQVILVAPAMQGSSVLPECFAQGLLDVFVHDSLHSLSTLTSKITSTLPGVLSEFPTKVGSVQPWSTDKPFVITPSKSYTVADMEQYANDVAAKKGGVWEFGPKFLPQQQKIAEVMNPLPVPTHFIYGSGLPTATQFEFDNDDFRGCSEARGSEPGDLIITSDSCKNVADAWKSAGASVSKHEVTDEVNHMFMIGCPQTLARCVQLLEEDHFQTCPTEAQNPTLLRLPSHPECMRAQKAEGLDPTCDSSK